MKNPAMTKILLLIAGDQARTFFTAQAEKITIGTERVGPGVTFRV
jgi:hypothetical protein